MHGMEFKKSTISIFKCLQLRFGGFCHFAVVFLFTVFTVLLLKIDSEAEVGCVVLSKSPMALAVSEIQRSALSYGQMSKIYTAKFNGDEVIIKIPKDQENFDLFSSNAKAVSNILGDLAIKYIGKTEMVLPNGKVERGMVFQKIEGFDLDSPMAHHLLQENLSEHIKNIELSIRKLLDDGIIPLDIQFMVTTNGQIKLFDFDLYLTPQAIEDNPTIAFGSQTVPLLDYIARDIFHYSRVRVSSQFSIWHGLEASDRINEISLIVSKALRDVLSNHEISVGYPRGL